MQQAGIGAGYIKNIINDRIASFLRRTDEAPAEPIDLIVRNMFIQRSILLVFERCRHH